MRTKPVGPPTGGGAPKEGGGSRGVGAPQHVPPQHPAAPRSHDTWVCDVGLKLMQRDDGHVLVDRALPGHLSYSLELGTDHKWQTDLH
jgi:hypothetical protein